MEESALSSRSSLFAMSEAGVERDWRIVQQSIKQASMSMSQLDERPPTPIDAPTTAGEDSV